MFSQHYCIYSCSLSTCHDDAKKEITSQFQNLNRVPGKSAFNWDRIPQRINFMVCIEESFLPSDKNNTLRLSHCTRMETNSLRPSTTTTSREEHLNTQRKPTIGNGRAPRKVNRNPFLLIDDGTDTQVRCALIYVLSVEWNDRVWYGIHTDKDKNIQQVAALLFLLSSMLTLLFLFLLYRLLPVATTRQRPASRLSFPPKPPTSPSRRTSIMDTVWKTCTHGPIKRCDEIVCVCVGLSF